MFVIKCHKCLEPTLGNKTARIFWADRQISIIPVAWFCLYLAPAICRNCFMYPINGYCEASVRNESIIISENVYKTLWRHYKFLTQIVSLFHYICMCEKFETIYIYGLPWAPSDALGLLIIAWKSLLGLSPFDDPNGFWAEGGPLISVSSRRY